jgi:hypothetical protein
MEIVYSKLESLEGKERMLACPWHRGMDVWHGWPGKQSSMFLLPGGPWFRVSLQSDELAAATLRRFGHVELVLRGGSLATSHLVLHTMLVPAVGNVTLKWYRGVEDLARLEEGSLGSVSLVKHGKLVDTQLPVAVSHRTLRVNTVGKDEEGRLYSVWVGDPGGTSVREALMGDGVWLDTWGGADPTVGKRSVQQTWILLRETKIACGMILSWTNEGE